MGYASRLEVYGRGDPVNDMTSITDYLIGKAIEDERARIIAALKAVSHEIDMNDWIMDGIETDDAIAIVRGEA